MKRARFRYLPHTADIAFAAYGGSFKELLENSALATIGLMFDLKKVRDSKAEAKTLRITERAPNMDDALWFTLQKIVSKVDERGVDAFGFKVNRVSIGRRGIIVHGCVFYKRVSEYSALLDIKAVTPHSLEVKKKGRRYLARVVVDV